MKRCRKKATYELRSDGQRLETTRAKVYTCGRTHFDGAKFLCTMCAVEPGLKW